MCLDLFWWHVTRSPTWGTKVTSEKKKDLGINDVNIVKYLRQLCAALKILSISLSMKKINSSFIVYHYISVWSARGHLSIFWFWHCMCHTEPERVSWILNQHAHAVDDSGCCIYLYAHFEFLHAFPGSLLLENSHYWLIPLNRSLTNPCLSFSAAKMALVFRVTGSQCSWSTPSAPVIGSVIKLTWTSVDCVCQLNSSSKYTLHLLHIFKIVGI